MTTPTLTPEAVAAAVERVERLLQEKERNVESSPASGGARLRLSRDAAALRLLLALAAEHVPVEDREQALDLAIPDADDGHDGDSDTCPRCLKLDEARRLLKLEDTDGE